MPNKPATQHRSVRIPDDRWANAKRNTEALGTDRGAWINEALAWLNREEGAKLPKRPPATE